MPAYSVYFARSARRELERLPNEVARRILSRLQDLTTNPRPSGCRKLTGSSHLWRIRVGDYRVIYEIKDEALEVDISVIRHRRDAYR
ncbi:MAG: type II toxin-antitoxin system RelE/ParE family toxin [Acidobacteriota bacterium]